jgi:hypothetical protein
VQGKPIAEKDVAPCLKHASNSIRMPENLLGLPSSPFAEAAYPAIHEAVRLFKDNKKRAAALQVLGEALCAPDEESTEWAEQMRSVLKAYDSVPHWKKSG